MGYTPGGGEERGRLAFVLINRVNQIADGYSTARSIVLGTAMAHELGHLLISKEHTQTGIMKAYFNQSDFRKARQGELRLTSEQARLIRHSISDRAVPSREGNVTASDSKHQNARWIRAAHRTPIDPSLARAGISDHLSPVVQFRSTLIGGGAFSVEDGTLKRNRCPSAVTS